MSLYAKMAQIMAEINYLPKSATNTHFNYKYTPDVVVYDKCRELLAAKGIALFASMTGVEQTFSTKTNAKGQEIGEWHSLVHFEFMLVDSESGETKTCTWSAEANDGQDKGINKCATAALKYWLLKTFIISTGDDPEAEISAPTPKTTPKPKTVPPTSKPNGQPTPPTASTPLTNGHTGSEDAAHWSRQPEPRGNFDRSMTYNHVDEGTIKVALGSEDPAISIDTLLLNYDSVGAAINQVLTYVIEHASS